MKRMPMFVPLIVSVLSLAAWPTLGQPGGGGGGLSGFSGRGVPTGDAEFMEVQRKQAEQRLDVAHRTFEENQALVQAVRNELLKVTGRVDVSADAIRKSAARVEAELESLQLDAVGAEARLAAIEKTVAEVTAHARDAGKSDEVAAELNAVVAAREHALQVKQKLHENKVASESDVQDARSALAEAKARLAERRQTVNAATGGGGGALSEWNREMFNLSHDAAERRARIKYLSERLDRLRAGLPLINRLAEAEAARDDAAARLASARSTLERIGQYLDEVNAKAAADAKRADLKRDELKKEERPK
jgi:hypothetical protein